jgi:hypothetical protein
MGVSLAHLTAIVVPVVGAALWERLGYQFPFLFGTVFIFISLWLTQKIDVPRQRVAGAPPLAAEREFGEAEMTADAALLPEAADSEAAGPLAAMVGERQPGDEEMPAWRRAAR